MTVRRLASVALCGALGALAAAVVPTMTGKIAVILAAAFLCMRAVPCGLEGSLLVGAAWLLFDVVAFGVPRTLLLLTWVAAPPLFARRG